MVEIAKEILTQTVNLINDEMPAELGEKKQKKNWKSANQQMYFIHAVSNSSSIHPGGKPGTFIIYIIYQFKTFLCKSTHNKRDGDVFVQQMLEPTFIVQSY